MTLIWRQLHKRYFCHQSLNLAGKLRSKISLCTIRLILGHESTLAGIPLTNTLGENRQFSLQIMFTSCPFNSTTIRYFLSKITHMYLCGIHYQRHWPNYYKGDSFGDIDAIKWDNTCRGPDRLVCGPAACMNHQFTVASQAWWGGDPHSEHRWLIQIKYDAFVTSAH